ncbi:MAG: hypothetical protein KAJ39_05005 [Gammaproteobacteria bacterium]|nr:hypothetical protein [Gammaproteobacteria bacterium]
MNDIKDPEIVKVQRVSTGIHITVPKSVSHILDDVKYVECTIDEVGIHYKPIVAK